MGSEMCIRDRYITVQLVSANLFLFFFQRFSPLTKNTILYLLEVVHNDMQTDRMLLRVPSRAIPGSVKASLSLTGR